MVKTITIKETVFNKLILHKGEDEIFSDLFERLLDNQVQGIETLTKLRGSTEFEGNDKAKIISDDLDEQLKAEF
jgi:predicted CopG family antitoxin